jgi:hypothetical protein
MARRGDQLREHMLWAAKDVFLEMGFERASMDLVASRAQTVIELVRGLFLTRLKEPGDYSGKPAEALVLFCGQYLEAMLYGPAVQMCRISMSESARFPEQAALYFNVLFTQVHARLSAYLKKTFGVSTRVSVEAAHTLMGQVLFPRHPRALFGLDPLAKSFDGEAPAPNFDLKPIRSAVRELMKRLAGE